MTKVKHRWMFGLVWLVLACQAGAASDAAVDASRQEITIALATEPPQLNSIKVTDKVSVMVLGHMMEGLVQYGRRGRIVPGVAKSWQLREDGATFHLRQDARWSDGKPVTADDFLFAWRKVLEPATASEYAHIMHAIKNAEKINKGELPATALGVQAPDAHTLIVEFERPVAYFLKLAAFVTYLPVRRDYYQAKGKRYAAEAADMLYNGPFVMTEWVHGASFRLEKNQHYWDKHNIKLNAINAAYITADTRARLNLFVDDKIVYTTLDGETYKDAIAQSLRIRRFASGVIFFLSYNFRPGRPTGNLNLRRAIQHVFDPDELVNKVLAVPGNLPGISVFPAWLAGVEGKFRQEYPAPRAPKDLTKARAYLEQAKQELGLDAIPPLTLVVSDSPTAVKQAEYLQGLLGNKLGLDIKIDAQVFKQRLAKMNSGDFDIVGSGWGPEYDDAMTFGGLFASWNLNNSGRFSNPEYDRMIRTAMNNTQPKVRMDAFGKAQQILFDHAGVLPMYEQGVIYLLHPQLKGVVRRVTSTDPDFTRAWIEP